MSPQRAVPGRPGRPGRPERNGRPGTWSPAALALGLVACVNAYPQRVPGPLVLPAEVAAPPATAELVVGRAAVVVQRDSDPVWVGHPGERGEYALPFYRKRERVPLGTRVRTGAGGRAEVLWSPDASTLVLFDTGRATIGDPERDEPMVRLHSITRALLVLTPEDRVELVGGALLAGDPLETIGPILLESVPYTMLRVTNQSKRLASLAYRDQRLELGPGESVDLPLLAGGTAPLPPAAEPQRLTSGVLDIAFDGRAERADDPGGVRLTAREAVVAEGLGVRARVAPGDTVRFSGLSRVPPPPPGAPRAEGGP